MPATNHATRLLLAYLLFFSEAVAQQFPLRNYTMHDGLSHFTVYRAYQDKKGFMWFSTDYGLSVFDGKNFKVVENDSLLYGSVISVSEDASGRKLISSVREGIIELSDSGINRVPLLNAAEFKYILYAVKYQHVIWGITRASNVSLFRVIDKQAKPYNVNGRGGTKAIFSRIIEYPDELLFASDQGLYRLRGNRFEPFLHNLIKGKVSDVKRSRDGIYWVSHNNILTGIKHNKIIYRYDFMPAHHIGNILCDKEGNIWIPLYSDGMYLLHDGVMEDITSRLDMPRTFINDLCEDNEGNIWIATYDAGVYKISSLNLLNYTYLNEHRHIFCHSLTPDGNGKIIIGTIGKLGLWEKGKIKSVEPAVFAKDEFTYFVNASGDKLYTGTPKGLYITDLRKSTTQLIAGSPGALCMLRDRNNKIWLGGYQHLFYLDADNHAVIEPSFRAIGKRRINALFEDTKHNLWIGTSNGLLKYDGKQYHEIAIQEKVSLKIINRIAEDKHGRIWAATEGGLLCVTKNGYRIYDSKNGLTHNKCNTLALDNHNTLWVGTLRGLSYIDIGSMDIKRYGAGIYPEEVLSLCFDSKNTLFIGTATGLSSIKTNRVNLNDEPPLLYITAVKNAGKVIPMPVKTNVPYYNSDLRIEFIGISLQNINTVEYRYKIEGLNSEWVYTPNTSIELSGLPPGNYTFLLNARKNKGAWGKPVNLLIHVSTPFWKTWWFISLSIILLLAVVFAIAQRYTQLIEEKKINRLAQSNKELALHNKITHLKQQALSALINPHFIFNCMNSIQHYLNRNDNDKANSYLADFAQLIRITMEDAREAFIGLDNEIKRIRLYLSLEQLRFGEKLHYSIFVSNDLDLSTGRIPNMILQPYIENAIWHGITPYTHEGKIEIAFTSYKDQLRITISDNGPGFKQTAAKTQSLNKHHIGLSVTSERLLLLKQMSNQEYNVNIDEITDGDGNIAGTRVTILLPLIPVEMNENIYTPGS